MEEVIESCTYKLNNPIAAFVSRASDDDLLLYNSGHLP